MKPREKLRITHLGEGSLASERTTAAGEAPRPEGLPQEGDIVGGCYRLTRRLGEGAFGSVYEAERTDVPEHRVALKIVERSVYAGRNVVRELVMLAATTHPNIVQLKDHGVSRDHVWLTMPLYEGETLAERLERGPLGMREAYEIFRPIARGVQALHERGLRHQDIKPENVFLARLSDRIHPVLLDLGVAVEKHATFVAGTALYGAPEQMIALGGMPGTARLSEKMDSYALGSTLLCALVGAEHFPGEAARTPYDLAEAFARREEQPLGPDTLPELWGQPRRDLERAFARWLRRDPEARPGAAELADELEVLLEPEREAARAIEATLELQRRAHRRTRVALLGLALGAFAVALFGYGHRETLRLASELRRARAEGRASFDKLDTCVAAHHESEARAAACESSRQSESQSHASAFGELRESSAAAEEDFARRLATVNGRLRTCRDEATEASVAFAQEREELVADRLTVERTLRDREAAWTEERAAFVKERDALTDERVTLLAGRERLQAEQTRLQAEQISCVESLESAREAGLSCASQLSSCQREPDLRPHDPSAGEAAKSAPEAPPAAG